MRQEQRNEQSGGLRFAAGGKQQTINSLTLDIKRRCGTCEDMEARLRLWPKQHPLSYLRVRVVCGECGNELYPPKENPND